MGFDQKYIYEKNEKVDKIYHNYCNCHHIFVKEPIDLFIVSHRIISNEQYFCCIKCGLTTRKMQVLRGFADELATKLYFWQGFHPNEHLFCRDDICISLTDALKLCQSIIDDNKDIDDETLKEMFEQKYDELKQEEEIKEKERRKYVSEHIDEIIEMAKVKKIGTMKN